MKKESFQELVFNRCICSIILCCLHFCRLRSRFPAATQQASISAMQSVFSALILGGLWGGIGGSIGMTIGDLFDPVYVVYAPKTFILKLCIGLITGLIAHHLGHITYQTDKRKSPVLQHWQHWAG